MKNKIIYTLLILSFGIFIYSCSDDILDIEPRDILTEADVFQSESAIEAYMATLYNSLPMEDFVFYRRTNFMIPLTSYTDEAVSVRFADERNMVGNGTSEGWWNYAAVRNTNDLIAKLPGSQLPESLVNSLLGEAKFLRAYFYFAMVKRYGGIPIIKEPQIFDGTNLEELQVSRNTEKEVYDFIADDLDQAALLLPETNAKGRATKYTALAYKSRVMLYAASSAKYSSVDLDGLLGIPAADADMYWQAAFDAADVVIKSGYYSLYEKNPDKTANFQQMFLDEDNPESLLSRFFRLPHKTHTWDCTMLPGGPNTKGPSGYSSIINPVVDLVEEFEYIDGTSGQLPVGTPENPVYYANPLDLFANRDPRLQASIIVPFSEFRGNLIDIQAGLYDLGLKVEAGSYNTLYNPDTHEIDNENGTLRIVGSHGLYPGWFTRSGFYIRKYLDTGLEQSLARHWGSSQPWVEIRYAEVLLNYAEAAVELGKIPEARDKVNIVRSRAGIALLDNADITIDRVRQERKVELAFENHRWWDMRRWRITAELLSNTRLRSLRPYYDVQQNAYRFEIGFAGLQAKTFDTRAYYERLPPGQLNTNPNLVQNPGY